MNIKRWIMAWLAYCSLSALAVEGHLSPEMMDKINGEMWTLGLSGITIGDIVKTLNNLGSKLEPSLKIGIDPTLISKNVKSFEIHGSSLADAADKVAKACMEKNDKPNANKADKPIANKAPSADIVKAFFVHDFLYIAKSLPPGITPAGITPTGAPPKGPPTPLTALRVVFPGVIPGASGKIAWLRKSPQECTSDLKPIALYIISDDCLSIPQNENEKDKKKPDIKKLNLAPAPFDKLILNDDIVVKALEEFTCVKVITLDANGWPAAMLNLGKHNVALLLLTADLHVVNHWEEVNAQITPQSFVAATVAVTKANQAVRDKLEKLAKKDEPKPKNEDEKDKEKKKLGLPGLKEKEKEGDKKPPSPEDNKTKPPKKPSDTPQDE